MTAPALPPEVERAIDAAANAAHDAGNAYGSDYWSSSEREFARITSENATAALRTAIRAALDKRGEVSAASAASARALGGDGEPVAWGVFDKNDCLWRSFDTQRDAEREVGHLNHRDDTGHYRACGPYTVVPLYAAPPAPPVSVERRMAFLNVEAAAEAAVKAEREACAKAIYAVRVVHRAEVERAVAEERAACAQVLNQMGDDDMASDREIAKWERAIEAIRARGAGRPESGQGGA